MVPAAEWKYFMDDGEMSRQTTDRMKGVFAGARTVFDALGRKVTQYEPGKELAPGITSVATHGHTPGHMSYIVASGNSKVYVQADVTNHPALFVRNPGWHAFFDQDAKMAEETRRKVYDMLVAEKMLVQGFHYPFPGMAYIEKSRHGLPGDSGDVESDALVGTTRNNGRPPVDGGLLFCSDTRIALRYSWPAAAWRGSMMATTRERRHDRTHSPVHSLPARLRPPPRPRASIDASAGACRSAARRQADARLVPHEGRHHRGDRDLRGRPHVAAAGQLCAQQEPRRGHRRASGRLSCRPTTSCCRSIRWW